jgi:hypothetical protein
MQVSLVSLHVTARHYNVWGYRTTWPYILTIMSTTTVFLDSEKAFDTTWQLGLLYKLSKLQFSTSLIKLIGSFVSQRKFRVSVESEISTSRYIQAGLPQVSVLSPTLYTLYINDSPQTPGVNLAPLCGRHMSICERLQGGLRSEKDTAWARLYGGLV